MSDSTVIDRRKNGKHKSTTIRQKFIKRARGQIKKAVQDAIEKRKVSDTGSTDETENTITIPSKGIHEPTFGHGPGGDKKYVIPGNDDKIVGDTIPKPKGGAGSGGPDASDSGDAEDDFVFTLTREEFLDFFFEDLELPNMVKTQLKEIDTFKFKRAGITTSGMPANLNILRSMKNAIGRQIALQAPYLKELSQAEEELENAETDEERELAELHIVEAQKKVDSVPFIDDVDIRYNTFEKRPAPSTKAVMFCLMDVSASMGEHEKDLAKRFFMLLYLFLERNYKKIDVVFIRHHHEAKEVNEHDFFYEKTSGGTIVSSCLLLMDEIIQDRYNTSDWNIYAAQASDGDNWGDDGGKCRAVLEEKIMPYIQYFAYIQIGREAAYNAWGSSSFSGASSKQLWNDYKAISDQYENFVMDQVDAAKDIYPVFRELFKKKGLEK